MTYLNYDPETCPDPLLSLETVAALLPLMGEAANKKICAEALASRDYTDTQIKSVISMLEEMSSRVTTVETRLNTFAAKEGLEALEGLLAALDKVNSDDDTKIAQLLEQLTIANGLIEKAQVAAEAAAESAAAARKIADENTGRVNGLDRRIEVTFDEIARAHRRIDALPEDTQIDPEKVRALANEQICANNQRVAAGAKKLVAGAEAFISALNKACPVPDSDPDPETGGDTPADPAGDGTAVSEGSAEPVASSDETAPAQDSAVAEGEAPSDGESDVMAM